MNTFLVFLSFVACIAAVTGTDYCSNKICNNGAKHIACDHSGKFDAICPPDAVMVQITDALKKVLVDAHNEKRNFIAGGGDKNHGPACRMATMEWDDELAEIAALNVKQCDMKHDKCRNTDTFRYSGQNLAWFGYTGPTNNTEKIKAAVQGWFDEVKDTKHAYIKSYPNGYSGPQIGHFTVMVADRNNRLGCGISKYFKEYNQYLIACNYATTNMINFPIYTDCKKGGMECKTGTNPQYPYLCSTSEHYNVNKWF